MDRAGMECCAVPVKIEKDSSWKDRVYLDCVELVKTGSTPDIQVLTGLSETRATILARLSLYESNSDTILRWHLKCHLINFKQYYLTLYSLSTLLLRRQTP